jgi:hypothetical protein
MKSDFLYRGCASDDVSPIPLHLIEYLPSFFQFYFTLKCVKHGSLAAKKSLFVRTILYHIKWVQNIKNLFQFQQLEKKIDFSSKILCDVTKTIFLHGEKRETAKNEKRRKNNKIQQTLTDKNHFSVHDINIFITIVNRK